MTIAFDATAALQFRYRPGDDILLAQLDLSAPGLEWAEVGQTDDVEVVDADCTIQWSVVGTHRVVRSLHVIAPAARLRQQRFPDLPPAVTAAITELIERSATLACLPSAAGGGAIDATVMFSISDLSWPDDRPAGARRPAPTRLAASRSLSAALTHLADALTAEADGTSDTHDVLPVLRFVLAIRELAGVVADDGRPAPGLAARAIDLLRGGLPLVTSERILLRHALADIDRVGTWRAVARSIDALAHVISDERRMRQEQEGQ